MTETYRAPRQAHQSHGNAPGNSQDDSEKGGHMMNEPDIGSGEKSPGERETDEQIRQIPQRSPQSPPPGP